MKHCSYNDTFALSWLER